MKKIVLMGRSECGKTTLTQALKGDKIRYHKTQYVNHFDVIIDTPGEYEADVVGLLLASTEPFSLYPPNITCMVNRDVIGIVTKADDREGNIDRARRWLMLAGCKKIFYVDSKTGEGVADLLEYLKEPGDVLPWEQAIKEETN